MDEPTAGGPAALAIAQQPQGILFFLAALFALLCLFSTSSGNLPVSSSTGLSSSASLGLGFAMTQGGLVQGGGSRLGAAGDDWDEGAREGGAKGVLPAGPLQNMFLSVQNMLGMGAPPEPVEMDRSSSSSEQTTKNAAAGRPKPSQTSGRPRPATSYDYDEERSPPARGADRQVNPRLPVGGPHPRQVGYGDSGGYADQESDRGQLVDASTPIYGSSTGKVGYGGTDGETDQEGGGDGRKHRFRKMFHRSEGGGEKKHHLSGMFHHKDGDAKR